MFFRLIDLNSEDLYRLVYKSAVVNLISVGEAMLLESIVRAFFPTVVAFFETEEGNREFEEWKAKKEAEKNAKEKSA